MGNRKEHFGLKTLVYNLPARRSILTELHLPLKISKMLRMYVIFVVVFVRYKMLYNGTNAMFKVYEIITNMETYV